MGPDSGSLAGTSPVYVTFVRQPQGYIGPELATQWTPEPFTLWLYLDDSVDEAMFEVRGSQQEQLPMSLSGDEKAGPMQLRQIDAHGDRGHLWLMKVPVRFPAPGCYHALFGGSFGERRITIRIDPAGR